MHSPLETEIKLAVSDPVSARETLLAQGFEVVTMRVFERNLVLDDENGTLRARGALLRLRSAGELVTCTYKGPETGVRHKIREEREFRASAFDDCLAVFTALGFTEKFRYEKFRTEFARPGEPGTATLDETPVGAFHELEGPPQWIDATAAQLGFSLADYITASYGKLYFEWCATRHIQPSNMCF